MSAVCRQDVSNKYVVALNKASGIVACGRVRRVTTRERQKTRSLRPTHLPMVEAGPSLFDRNGSNA